MRIIGVIPARFASTRFAGKVLAEIAGRPMIQHVYDQVKKCNLLDNVIIACDDDRVFTCAQKFGAQVIMTDPVHPTGTDRIVEVVKDLEASIVINIQGDEPLIQPTVIDQLAGTLKDSPSIVMGTVIKAIRNQEEITDPNTVKVVIDQDGFALYFSRSPIPYQRNTTDLTYYKHLGLYAYTKEFLMAYAKMPKSSLELTESLEQLRVLEAGYKIKTIVTDHETIGVDTPEDLVKVEALINERRL